MLKIEKSQSVADVEGYYHLLAQDPVDVDLTVPTNLREAHLGAVGALIQFLITWSKRYPNARLLLHTTDESKFSVHLENLSTSHHGVLALLLASDVLSANKTKSVTESAQRITQLSIEKMTSRQYGDTSGGESLLFCADWKSPRSRFIHQFYHPTDNSYADVRSHSDFVTLASGLIEHISRHLKRHVPPGPELRHNLGTIFYELFKNTHKWARTDADGVPINKSIRGLRLQFTSRETIRPSALSERHVTYLESLTNKLGLCDILEITIFDSGPGLAARALERELDASTTLSDEYALVLSRLQLRATSSSTSHHGIGLVEVMRTLTKAKAFARLRTGRLALCRDFLSSPFEKDDDIWLDDWTTGTKTLSELPRAEGLLFTILMPVLSKDVKHG